MKKLLKIAIFVFAILSMPGEALAQSTGQWVPCLDPGGSGQMVSCFVPFSTQRRSSGVVTNNPSQQVAVIVNQQIATQPIYGNQRYYNNRSVHRVRSQPVYEDEEFFSPEVQKRRIVRKGCDYGIGRYSGRIYADCSLTSETETITLSAGYPSNGRTVWLSRGSYPGPNRTYGW